MTHYGKREACDQSHLSPLSLTFITLGLLWYYRWSMNRWKDAHSKLIFFKRGFEVCSWKSRKISFEIYRLEGFRAHRRVLCRIPMRSFRFDKINPLFTSFTGLGAIIAEERNYMESYTFFKVRNVVAIKGNTSSRHFTTPRASYFTENITKERNESPCLTSSI